MRDTSNLPWSRRYALLVLLPLCLGGCPTGSQLEDPDAHLDAQACDVASIFAQSCAGVACHTPAGNGSAVGVIDLVTPGFEAALVDRPSDYSAVADAADCPPAGSELIVNRTVPTSSLLLKKTNGTHLCGLPMPPPPYPALSAGDLECIRQFTLDLAADAPSGTAGQGGAT